MTTEAQALISKAVAYTRTGGYDVIEVIEREVRVPVGNEVRIKVAAAGVNPTDIMFRDPGMPDLTFPFVPGMEAAGTIKAIGPDASRFAVGDEVMTAVMPSRPEGGAQAEYIVVPEASVALAPTGVPLAAAATLPMNGLTALQALELAALQPRRWLAISGGAGQLARYAIAAAKRQGIMVVADAKPEDTDIVQGTGADVVVERGPDFARAVRAVIPDGVDALLDTAVLAEQSFGAIRDAGVYLPVRGWGDRVPERGIVAKPVFVFQVLGRTEWLDQLAGMAATGEIQKRATVPFRPSDAAEAQRALIAGGTPGRPVIVSTDYHGVVDGPLRISRCIFGNDLNGRRPLRQRMAVTHLTGFDICAGMTNVDLIRRHLSRWETSPLSVVEAAPWHIVDRLEALIRTAQSGLPDGYIERDGFVLHASAEIESGVILKGIGIIGPRCYVASGAYLRGGVLLGEDCTIGPSSELKSSVILSGSKLAHLNFVGDSIIGSDVNIEAGAIVANYRNEKDDKAIRIEHDNQIIETGVMKFGALIGDGTRIGANAVIAPGAILGAGSRIGRLQLVDQYPR